MIKLVLRNAVFTRGVVAGSGPTTRVVERYYEDRQAVGVLGLLLNW